MTVTELIESMKSIIDGYDRGFAEQMEGLPKEAKTERKALHIQRGMCNVVKAACLLAYSTNAAKLHISRINRFPAGETDMQTLSTLDGAEWDNAAVYLNVMNYAKVSFVTPYTNELSAAEKAGDEDMVFELTLKLKTFDAILTSLRKWWAVNGCAEFEV